MFWLPFVLLVLLQISYYGGYYSDVRQSYATIMQYFYYPPLKNYFGTNTRQIPLFQTW